jgi:hypothetical protein
MKKSRQVRKRRKTRGPGPDRRRQRKSDEKINRRGVSDKENAELVARFGHGGVFFPAPGQTTVIFLKKPGADKKK